MVLHKLIIYVGGLGENKIMQNALTLNVDKKVCKNNKFAITYCIYSPAKPSLSKYSEYPASPSLESKLLLLSWRFSP